MGMIKMTRLYKGLCSSMNNVKLGPNVKLGSNLKSTTE